jgi:hypothetical protein
MSRPSDSDRRPAAPSAESSQVARPQAPALLESRSQPKRVLGESARQMLDSWDEAKAKAAAADPNTPQEILDHWLLPENLQPSLLPILVENPAVATIQLLALANRLSGESREVVLRSRRVRETRVSRESSGTTEVTELKAVTVPETGSGPEDSETEKALIAFSQEHAAEIATQEEKPFQPLGGFHDLLPAVAAPQALAAAAPAAAGPTPSAPQTKPPTPKKPAPGEEERRGSVLQKIARLDIKGRIQLAIKGTKEERSILIRDGTKIVALAVLESPKITDGEVEKFATQKNVLEAVLRAIPLRRRFAKNYAVVRNLAFNPRTPIDVALTLVKNLLIADLKNLSGNKEVSETVRKIAFRLFKQKHEANQKQ